MSKTSQDEPMVHSAPLVDFLNTLPSPLTTTLVGLAPAIAHTRHALQVITWRGPREECWLALSTWWAICLVPEIGLRCVEFGLDSKLLPFACPRTHFLCKIALGFASCYEAFKKTMRIGTPTRRGSRSTILRMRSCSRTEYNVYYRFADT